jgi:hypothetical protein
VPVVQGEEPLETEDSLHRLCAIAEGCLAATAKLAIGEEEAGCNPARLNARFAAKYVEGGGGDRVVLPSCQRPCRDLQLEQLRGRNGRVRVGELFGEEAGSLAPRARQCDGESAELESRQAESVGSGAGKKANADNGVSWIEPVDDRLASWPAHIDLFGA